jgi:hypothetical protein
MRDLGQYAIEDVTTETLERWKVSGAAVRTSRG